MSSEPKKTGVTTDDDPEIYFQPEWGEMVRRARATKKWSQQQLADLLGVEQATVSHIENYKTKSSKLVRRITELLGIPMPEQYFSDELEKRWVESGRVLRHINESGFRGLLHGAEMMIANTKDPDEPDEH